MTVGGKIVGGKLRASSGTLERLVIIDKSMHGISPNPPASVVSRF